jgi:hypothetical protein
MPVRFPPASPGFRDLFRTPRREPWSPHRLTCMHSAIRLQHGASVARAGGGKTDGMLGEWANHADRYGKDAIGTPL